MNRSQSKYFNTAAKMDEAFLSLLETKDFAYITVKEICEKACVNRSTFYLHYETIGDLLAESSDYVTQQFLSCMPHNSNTFMAHLPDCPPDELFLITPKYLEPYLSYIRENRRLFRTLLENAEALRLRSNYDGLLRHVLEPILVRYGVPEADRGYMLAFYIHGLMAIIRVWLQNDCQNSIEHIIALMQQCIRAHR